MIFRSKKGKGGAAVADRGPELLAAYDSVSTEMVFEEIDALTREHRASHDEQIGHRILMLRYLAGRRLARAPDTRPEHPAPAADQLPADSGIPEIAPGELTPELLRAGMLRNGCVLIRGLIDTEEAAALVDGIDRAFESRDARGAGRRGDSAYFAEFDPEPGVVDLFPERGWVGDASGIWAADSPRVMVDVLDAFERGGLQRVATEYLGERPVISVNKCTLRKVKPDLFQGENLSAWHQDGAFLGDEVRALNVWLSLSRCGDEAPGLDIIPRRLERIVPTGTEGAVFDWSVSQAVAEEAAGDVAIARPIFEPGDVLLFDDLFLHATAAEPEMPNTRYAVESWFFGPSGFPSDYAPLAF